MSQGNTMNGKTWDEIKQEPMNWIQLNIDHCNPEDSFHVKAQNEIPYALVDVMDKVFEHKLLALLARLRTGTILRNLGRPRLETGPDGAVRAIYDIGYCLADCIYIAN